MEKERLRSIVSLSSLGLLVFALFASFPKGMRMKMGKDRGWKCEEGDRKFSDGWMLEFHHIIPESQGGEDTEDNAILLCLYHHLMAHLDMGDEDSARLIEERLVKTNGRTEKWLREHR